MDLWVLKEVCLDDVYLPHPVQPEPDWSVLDIGGGIGEFAVWMATRCPRGIVHSYEPLIGAFSLLQENVVLNGIGNVVAHRAAVAAREGEGALRWSAGQPPVLARFVKGGEGEPRVVARTLASALAALPGAGCDLMKIDCEGGEFDLLLGADCAILDGVQRISLEFHEGVTSHRGADLARHLSSCGYRVRLIPNPVHGSLGQLYAERVTDAAGEAKAPVTDGPG
jgi:FkbM family methyltransferase